MQNAPRTLLLALPLALLSCNKEEDDSSASPADSQPASGEPQDSGDTSPPDDEAPTAEEIETAYTSSYAVGSFFAAINFMTDLLDDETSRDLLGAAFDGEPAEKLQLPAGSCPAWSYEAGTGLVMDYGKGCTNARGHLVAGRAAIQVSLLAGVAPPMPVTAEVSFEEYVRDDAMSFTGMVSLMREGDGFSLGDGKTGLNVEHEGRELDLTLGSTLPSYLEWPEEGPCAVPETPDTPPVASWDGERVGVYGQAEVMYDWEKSYLAIPEGTIHWAHAYNAGCRCPEEGSISFTGLAGVLKDRMVGIEFQDDCSFTLYYFGSNLVDYWSYDSEDLPTFAQVICDPVL